MKYDFHKKYYSLLNSKSVQDPISQRLWSHPQIQFYNAKISNWQFYTTRVINRDAAGNYLTRAKRPVAIGIIVLCIDLCSGHVNKNV